MKGESGHLVLGRKPGQSIMIGDNIVVEIASVRGNSVQVGIRAPKDVAILREELCANKEEFSKKGIVDRFKGYFSDIG